jgi:hypothetical protein
MNTTPKAVLTAVATLALLAAGGCHHDAPDTKYDGMKFTQEGDSTSIGRLAESQAAAGAKADAMLHENAFDGPVLNSLGQGKLDLMVKATLPGQPIVVYLAISHDTVALRQPAVAAYLQAHGVPETQVVMNEGTNPNGTVTAAYTMGSVYKMDGGIPTGAPAETGGGGISGAAAAAK